MKENTQSPLQNEAEKMPSGEGFQSMTRPGDNAAQLQAAANQSAQVSGLAALQRKANGTAAKPIQRMWNGKGDKKIETFDDLNTELTALGLQNVTLAGDFKNATQTSVDAFIKASNINAYSVADDLAEAVNAHFVNPANCTLETNAGRSAWINYNNKAVTDKGKKDLIDVANGDASKVHRSDKMQGEPKQTPYVHDTGSNFVASYTITGTNWDGFPIIKVNKTGDVNNGVHRFN